MATCINKEMEDSMENCIVSEHWCTWRREAIIKLREKLISISKRSKYGLRDSEAFFAIAEAFREIYDDGVERGSFCERLNHSTIEED